MAQWVKNLPGMQEIQQIQFRSLGQEDPLEKEMATHFSTLAWKIPWTEELAMTERPRICKWFPGGAVVKNSPANAGDARHMGSMPGAGRSPGVGNGNPLKYSCLENSLDGGAPQSVGSQRDRYDWVTAHTHMQIALSFVFQVCWGLDNISCIITSSTAPNTVSCKCKVLNRGLLSEQMSERTNGWRNTVVTCLRSHRKQCETERKSRTKAQGCKPGDKFMLLSWVAKPWDEKLTTNDTKKPDLVWLLFGSCLDLVSWMTPGRFHIWDSISIQNWSLIKFLIKVVKGNIKQLHMQRLCWYSAPVDLLSWTLPPGIH